MHAQEVKSLTYHDKDVLIERAELSAEVKNAPLYKQINQKAAYEALLDLLEESIVEASSNEQTLVQFTKITIINNNADNNKIQLDVHMNIDGQACSVSYHLDVHTGEMNCDDSGFKGLNSEEIRQEPQFDTTFPKSRLSEIEQDVKEAEEVANTLSTNERKITDDSLISETSTCFLFITKLFKGKLSHIKPNDSAQENNNDPANS